MYVLLREGCSFSTGVSPTPESSVPYDLFPASMTLAFIMTPLPFQDVTVLQ